MASIKIYLKDMKKFIYSHWEFLEHIFEPYKNAGYPLNRIGSILRVPIQFLHNWIDIPKLIYDLKYHFIYFHSYFLTLKKNITQEGLKNLFVEALAEIGTESYTREWQNPKTMEHLKTIDGVVPAVKAANNFLPEFIKDKIIEFFKRENSKNLTILDVGTGLGATIAPVIQMIHDLSTIGQIPKNYHKRVTVILYDISREALLITRDKLTKRITVDDYHFKPIEDIRLFQDNFVSLINSKSFKISRDTIDIIISGGAIMHNSNHLPFYKYMYSLLKEGGIIAFYDWCFGHSWVAPILKVRDDKKHKLAEPFSSWEFEDINHPVIYEILPEDVKIIKFNFGEGWLGRKGLLGYHDSIYENIWESFNEDFDKFIHGRGFNFIEWLRTNVVGKFPEPPEEKQTPYHMIEGYIPLENTAEIMKKVGFKKVKVKRLDKFPMLNKISKSSIGIFIARGGK